MEWLPWIWAIGFGVWAFAGLFVCICLYTVERMLRLILLEMLERRRVGDRVAEVAPPIINGNPFAYGGADAE